VARYKVIIAVRAEVLLAIAAYDEPFTVIAELFTAREAPTSWHATKAFLPVTIRTKAEMTIFWKVVTFSATKLAPRFHLAVFALFLGTTLYTFYKSNFISMGYTKALAQMKHVWKLLDRHEMQNRTSVQKIKHAVAHRFLWQHNGKEHQWRIFLLLRLDSATSLSCHHRHAD
jgi:hypothetical protein